MVPRYFAPRPLFSSAAIVSANNRRGCCLERNSSCCSLSFVLSSLFYSTTAADSKILTTVSTSCSSSTSTSAPSSCSGLTSPLATSWTQPSGFDTKFSVFNSITKSVNPLVVRDPNAVTWYQCGPTVYAPAHLGHAWWGIGEGDVCVCVCVERDQMTSFP